MPGSLASRRRLAFLIGPDAERLSCNVSELPVSSWLAGTSAPSRPGRYPSTAWNHPAKASANDISAETCSLFLPWLRFSNAGGDQARSDYYRDQGDAGPRRGDMVPPKYRTGFGLLKTYTPCGNPPHAKPTCAGQTDIYGAIPPIRSLIFFLPASRPRVSGPSRDGKFSYKEGRW